VTLKPGRGQNIKFLRYALIEKKLSIHDDAITATLSAIRELMNPPPPKRRGIGFTADPSQKG